MIWQPEKRDLFTQNLLDPGENPISGISGEHFFQEIHRITCTLVLQSENLYYIYDRDLPIASSTVLIQSVKAPKEKTRALRKNYL